MAPPPSWIVATAVVVSSRPIEHGLNPLAHPRRCLCLFAPDWIKSLHHKPRVDCLHRQRPQHGVRVGLKGTAPLCSVLDVAPSGLVSVDIARRAVLKRDGLRGFKLSGLLALPPRLDRINALPEKPSASFGTSPGISQRYIGVGPKTHPTLFSVQREPEQPRPSPIFHLQIKPDPSGCIPGPFRRSAVCASRSTFRAMTTYVCTYDLFWIMADNEKRVQSTDEQLYVISVVLRTP